MSATSPLRYPDVRSPGVMTRRAWWLVVLNFLLPGSVQLLAGDRRLGRVGVISTFILWLLAIIAVIVFAVNRSALIGLGASVPVLVVLEVLLAGYAILWLVLTLDTLRLVRLVRLGRVARPVIAVLTLGGLLLTAGGAGYAATVADSARSAITSIFDSGEYQPPADGRYNILLLGGDAGPDRQGLRPDSISVVSVDADTGATTIIGLPRNLEQVRFAEGSPLYTEYPNGYDCGDECLLGYLYTVGQENPELYPDAQANGSQPGIEAMRDAVSGVTGLTVQYYVLIDMQGFSQLIDALGGVTVEVPARTPIGPITSRTPIGYVEAGTQHLDGETALWYARTRFDSNDFERMERQRQVQQAIFAQMEPLNVLGKFNEIAAAGSQVVSTDIPEVMLGYFVDLAAKSRTLPLGTLELVPPQVDNANPDYDEIRRLIAESFVVPEPAQ